MKYHVCISPSWESGQDVSSRFGPQQTGGTIIQQVRPVDLQASMAQGASILARWAELLVPTHTDEAFPNPYPAEMAFWNEVANEFTIKTRLMWHNGWFRDYDSVARVWSSERDAMHLAPVFCDTADEGQIKQLHPTLAENLSKRFFGPVLWTQQEFCFHSLFYHFVKCG